jgi:phage baseplate assembly protein V
VAEPVDTPRLIGDLLREGVVIERAGATCRVAIGDLESGPLPWLAGRAGDATIWSPPSLGEQVLVLTPEGDLARAIVLPGLYSDAQPAPANDASTMLRFADGTTIHYDPAERHLNASVPGGSATIEADDIVLLGSVTIIGDVQIGGTLTASRDVVAAGKSLKDHVHTKVQAGGAISGPPQ